MRSYYFSILRGPCFIKLFHPSQSKRVTSIPSFSNEFCKVKRSSIKNKKSSMQPPFCCHNQWQTFKNLPNTWKWPYFEPKIQYAFMRTLLTKTIVDFAHWSQATYVYKSLNSRMLANVQSHKRLLFFISAMVIYVQNNKIQSISTKFGIGLSSIIKVKFENLLNNKKNY